MFIRTTAINKLKQMKARKRVVQGSTGAGKTHGIVPITCIDEACKRPGITITVVAESIPAVKSGSLKIFMDIMIETNRWNECSYNRTERIYTFNNRATVQFTSFETVGKAKAAGKREILFLNEANHIPYEIADALMIRSKETWIDYNPDKNFWAHTEVLTEPNSELLILTYKDNEALPEETLEDLLIKKAKAFNNPNLDDDKLFEESNIKSNYWANWWRVYGLGQVGTLEGVIFQNWKEIDTIPVEAKLLGYGMDFGFTNDPTTMIAVYKYNSQLILDEVIYQKGLLNSQIASMIKSIGAKNGPIYADSSEPKSIADIQGYGVGIYSVKKGVNSVKEGIQLMQEYEFLVTKKSTHLKEELNKYEWSKKNPSEPIEIFNHCFTGETLITTIEGQKRIDCITENDYVLTSRGYKKVLKRFDNGLQQVSNYSMQFDTFNVSLCSTKEHKIKTLKTWTKISELKSEQQVFLFNSSPKKNINYTQKKSIFQEVEKDCTLLCGNTTTEKFQKDFTYIIKMITVGTMQLIISNLSKLVNICQNTQRKGLKQTRFGSMISIPKELRKQKNGTNQNKDYNGTKNMGKEHGTKENIRHSLVFNAEKNIKQDTQEYLNSVIKTAELLHLEVGEEQSKLTYDLMVEDCHEYFANGILVHNCIDATRYLVWMRLGSRGSSNPISSFTMDY